MYTLPQEIEVWYIIPAIRREISKCLVQKHKISYEKIGKLLGLTKSAVSQYIKNKRAAKIRLHPKIPKEIIISCGKMVNGKSNSVEEIMRILKIIQVKRLHCEVCGRIIKGKLHDCKQVLPYYKDI